MPKRPELEQHALGMGGSAGLAQLPETLLHKIMRCAVDQSRTGSRLDRWPLPRPSPCPPLQLLTRRRHCRSLLFPHSLLSARDLAALSVQVGLLLRLHKRMIHAGRLHFCG
jgi:hypothetical protein